MVFIERRIGNRSGRKLTSYVKNVPTQSIFKRGYLMYNVIPNEYKQINNRESFKKNIKRWVKENIVLRIT